MEVGYASSTMRAIAERAGVAERTVYLAFPSKPALLSAVISRAVRGDEPSARLLDSAAWRRLVKAPTDDLARTFAELIERVLHDAAGLLVVGQAAAGTHPELKALSDQGNAAEHEVYRAFVRLLGQRDVLVSGTTVEEGADILYAVASPAIYLRLTNDRRWSRCAYVAWLERTITASLLTDRRGHLPARSDEPPAGRGKAD